MCLILMSVQVFFSMLEIYNEQVTLLWWDFTATIHDTFCVFTSLLGANFALVSLFPLLSDQVVDLLCRGSRAPGGLRVREEQQRGFYVEGLRTVPCDSASQVEMNGKYMERKKHPNTDVAISAECLDSRISCRLILRNYLKLPK